MRTSFFSPEPVEVSVPSRRTPARRRAPAGPGAACRARRRGSSTRRRPPTAEVVITEGNYLLLDTTPWVGVRAVTSEVWFLDTPEDLRVRRMIDRHIRYGRSPEAARERAETGSDARNAALVLASRAHADVLLQP